MKLGLFKLLQQKQKKNRSIIIKAEKKILLKELKESLPKRFMTVAGFSTKAKKK